MQLVRMKSVMHWVLNMMVSHDKGSYQCQVLPPTLWIAFAIYFPLGFINVLHPDFLDVETFTVRLLLLELMWPGLFPRCPASSSTCHSFEAWSPAMCRLAP